MGAALIYIFHSGMIDDVRVIIQLIEDNNTNHCQNDRQTNEEDLIIFVLEKHIDLPGKEILYDANTTEQWKTP